MVAVSLDAAPLVASSAPIPVEASDRELMARLVAGDREALSPLVERHYRRLYRIALSYLRDPDDALDCVQEAFVKVVERAGSWRDSADVGPWLTRILVNQAIDRYRRGKRRGHFMEPLAEGDHDQALECVQPAPDRGVAARETRARVDAALRGLPATQRAVFVLRHYEEHSLEEIARTLGLSLGTVKSSLHRALQRVRLRLLDLRP
jgi:RNA polymerase sigma-70 factor (ECF subfamily)